MGMRPHGASRRRLRPPPLGSGRVHDRRGHASLDSHTGPLPHFLPPRGAPIPDPPPPHTHSSRRRAGSKRASSIAVAPLQPPLSFLPADEIGRHQSTPPSSSCLSLVLEDHHGLGMPHRLLGQAGSTRVWAGLSLLLWGLFKFFFQMV
jgi:hypothetical protein